MSLKLNSSGGGSVTLQEPVTASDLTVNLPATLGNTGNSMAVTSDASGNVGVGVTPAAWNTISALQIKNAAFAGFSSTAYIGTNWFNQSGDKYITSTGAALYTLDGNTSSHKWYTAPSGTAGNAISFTQAMTLDASGNLLIGKTSANTNVVGTENRPDGFFISTKSTSTNADTTMQVYSTGASALRFYIGMGGTVFATSTTISAISDQRLKENVQDLDAGLDKIMALKPRKFDWKEGKGKDIKGDRGWIAQEFEQVFPDMVDEWRDPSPEGEEPYKSVRADLIPVLVKSIQELKAELNTVKAELAVLKGTA
jgi:hypothetical protein